MKAIEATGLKKSYGEVKAVKGIDFSVEQGSLFAFLGINGAGKSTTINMLCTLLQADEGKAVVCGHDLKTQADKIREKIGVIFQGSVLDKRLSVKDNLASRASFYGIFGEKCKKRIGELADLLDLHEILSRPYGKLSGGQRRRVDVARGLVNRPELLFLDEPTTGLDPQTRKHVWEVLEKLRRKTGMTVFLTTHYMEEADGADNVVIIDEGSIAATGTPVQLKNRFSSDYVKVYCPQSQAEQVAAGRKFVYENGCCKICVKNSGEAKAFLLESATPFDFEVIKGNMDDVFLTVTGKKLNEVQ